MPNKLVVDKTEKFNYKHPSNLHENFLVKVFDKKSEDIYEKVKPHIIGEKILDVGTGSGGIACFLETEGYEVGSIDVEDLSVLEGYPTKVYDGLNIPYKDNSFDTALIVHVLHHCTDRRKVLREARRVAKRVIFIDDTYRNSIEHAVVSFNDMLGNWEWYQHPYSTIEEWDSIAEEEEWDVKHKETYSDFTYGVFYSRYVLYVFE